MALGDIKLKRSKKSELLIGVMIGIYGNWLIALVEKLENTELSAILLFVVSFAPFISYFYEIHTEIENQSWLRWMPSKTILGTIYILLIFGSLMLSGLFETESLFSASGIVFWFMLMKVEDVNWRERGNPCLCLKLLMQLRIILEQ